MADLNLKFENGKAPALNATNLNAMVDGINDKISKTTGVWTDDWVLTKNRIELGQREPNSNSVLMENTIPFTGVKVTKMSESTDNYKETSVLPGDVWIENRNPVDPHGTYFYGLLGTSEKAKQNETDITTIKTDLSKLSITDKNLEKRVTNLEYASQGILYRADVDDSEAITKNVDSGALPYASLDVIGAKSLAPNNLFNEDNLLSIGFTKTNDGYYGESKTTTIWTNTNNVSGKLYGHYLIKCIDNRMSLYIEIKYTDNTSESKYLWGTVNEWVAKDFETDASKTVSTIGISYGAKASNYLKEFIISKNNAPYQPYFTGIKNANLKEIVSVGANIVNPNNMVHLLSSNATNLNVNASAISFWCPVQNGKTYTVTKTKGNRFAIYGTNEVVDGASCTTLFNNNSATKATITNSGNHKYLVVYCSNVAIDDVDIQVKEGSNETPFTPYFEETINYTTLINKYFPNSMKSAGSVFDVIDLVNGKAIKKVGSVDLGTLNWQYDGANNYFVSSSTIPRKFQYGYIDMFMDGYESVGTRTNLTKNKTVAPYNNTNSNNVCIKDTAYTDANAFKSAMNGVMLYYEMAEYEETDIAQEDIEKFKYLTVEGGGSLYFKTLDEFDVAIPTTETFAIKTGGAN